VFCHIITVLLYLVLVLVLKLYLSTFFEYWYWYLHAKYWYLYWYLNLQYWYWYWYTCNKVLVAKKKITVKPYIFEMQQIASTIRSRLGVLDT